MNRNYFILISLIIFGSLVYYFTRFPMKSKNAQVVELDPSMSNEQLSADQLDYLQNPQAYSYAYEAGAIREGIPNIVDVNNNGLPDEEFRIQSSGGGGSSGPRFGTSGGGGMSMGGGSGAGRGGGGMGTGMGRGGGSGNWGGRGSGMGRGSGNWGNRYWGRRPFRGYFPYYNYSYFPFYNYDYSFPYDDYNYDYYQPAQQFTVKITNKQSTHPFYNQGFSLGYSIIGSEGSDCGISGGKIVLRRGQTYQFNISTGRTCDTNVLASEPFFFSSSSSGGSASGNIFGVKPVVNGVLTITIDNSVPDLFYYQSTNHKYVGGIVEVV